MEYRNTLRENLNESNIDSYKSLNKLINNEDVEIGDVLSGYKAISDKIIHDIYHEIINFYNKVTSSESKNLTCEFESFDYEEVDDEEIGTPTGKNVLIISNYNSIIELTWRYTPNDGGNQVYLKYNLSYVADTYLFPLICFNGNYDKVFHFDKFYIGDSPRLIIGNLTDDSFDTVAYFIDNFNKFENEKDK